jgi:ABC-type transport system involved in Fe-S cluster assembly fused permease/ATPase subunit
VVERLTLGDLVMINHADQLYICSISGRLPAQQAVTDLTACSADGARARGRRRPQAKPLAVARAACARRAPAEALSPVLHDLSFESRPADGRWSAVRRRQGTLARLLYRFYDVTGAISIDGRDIRQARRPPAPPSASSRRTPAFNDTVAYNIASRAE